MIERKETVVFAILCFARILDKTLGILARFKGGPETRANNVAQFSHLTPKKVVKTSQSSLFIYIYI